MTRRIAAVLFALLGLIPSAVLAQTGAISGTVRDTGGGVLPGVTVEATSPVLIEKVRSVFTDGQGLYRVIDLRPGEYTLVFTLPGFSTVRREGVVLTADGSVNIAVEMQVGALEETIIVSGSTPLVDIQGANQQTAFTRTEIEELPTGRQWFSYLAVLPGVSRSTRGQDVGGSTGDQSQALSVHGSVGGEMTHNWDGMRWGNMHGQGGGSNGPYPINNAMIEEMSVETSGAGADAEVPGVRTNVIPKQGGNRFTAYFAGNYTNDSLQSDNLDDDLIRRGARSTTITKRIYDINPAFGGPLKRDRVWFYGSFRRFGSTELPSGAFFDTDPYDLVFTEDLARGPADNPSWTTQGNLRVTANLGQRHKIALYSDENTRCTPCAIGLSSTVAWEGTTKLVTPISRIMQATWTWTVNNRLLIDVGETYKPDAWEFRRQDLVRDDLSAITDAGTGIRFRAPTTGEVGQHSRQWNGRLNVNYVTGSHNLKVGTQWFHGERIRTFRTPNNSFYTFRNNSPDSVTTRATPMSGAENLKMNLGIYVQEQWTFRRVTLNAGLRYDYLNLYIPEQHLPPAPFVGARDFAEIPNVPNWHDISPRLGAAYDLFGDGRTALKWNLGRFVEANAGSFPEAVNPITANALATRTWNDADKDFIPDCDLSNQRANGECLQSNNLNFGLPVVPLRYDPRAVTGWGTRTYNWESMVGVQHQVLDGLAVEASYHRRSFGNFRSSDNLKVGPGDFDEFCVTAPVDPRLPNSGQAVCGLYNVRQDVFGQSDTFITKGEDFGQEERVYDGFDLSVSTRFRGGLSMQAGTSTGRTRTDTCFVVDSPEEMRFCDRRPPMQTQFKASVVYPLPWWGLQTSAAIQSLEGPEILATWAAPASAVSGLGRPLSGGARTVSVALIEPGTMYGERLNQVDFRVAKNFEVRGARVQPQLDLYNMFNDNAVYGQNNTYGSAWQRPTSVLVGRLVKFGVQVNF